MVMFSCGTPSAFATAAATTANEERVGLGLTTRHLQQEVAANETAAEAEHEDEEHAKELENFDPISIAEQREGTR